MQGLWANYKKKKYNTFMMRLPGGEERGGNQKNKIENFPQIVRHQTTESGSSGNTKSDKYQKIYT